MSMIPKKYVVYFEPWTEDLRNTDTGAGMLSIHDAEEGALKEAAWIRRNGHPSAGNFPGFSDTDPMAVSHYGYIISVGSADHIEDDDQ